MHKGMRWRLQASVPDFDSIPFESVTFFQQQKISNQKMPSLLKFLTAQKDLF